MGSPGGENLGGSDGGGNTKGGHARGDKKVQKESSNVLGEKKEMGQGKTSGHGESKFNCQGYKGPPWLELKMGKKKWKRTKDNPGDTGVTPSKKVGYF